jgi:hypothetical protein
MALALTGGHNLPLGWRTAELKTISEGDGQWFMKSGIQADLIIFMKLVQWLPE